jgi:hypothetical protein
MVANPTGETVFGGGDEATQTTRANFSEYTVNPPKSTRSLSMEFKYTLYIETK